MNKQELLETVKIILEKGKGILAADETPQNIGKKFEANTIDNNENTRQQYRELLFTSNGIEKYISGVILQDETIRQSTKDHQAFVKLLAHKKIISGIKVDLGLKDFRNSTLEKETQGLDGLDQRLKEYYNMGARFAKWRAVIVIDSNKELPTSENIETNMSLLAEYAYLCQQNNIVPIVEPEVLMDGSHTMKENYNVTKLVLNTLFKALKSKGVLLEGLLLKPNMVVPGEKCPFQEKEEDIAKATIDCFKETVPPEVPGIVFLSGGQTDDRATRHLALMVKNNPQLPWILTFSYGRALQTEAIKAWAGKTDNVAAGQNAFLKRAEENYNAALGKI